MESSSVNEPASLSPFGTKLEKPTRKRKLPAKFRDPPIEETPKQYKTPSKKKLVLEKGESDKKKSFEPQKKTQNDKENRENVEKELASLVVAEKKELLKKVSVNKRAAGRMSTGEMKKTPVVKRARSSLGSWASFNRTKSVTAPKDEDLPEFDPENFTPGYVPKTVKKGDEEYVIVVSGVPDTGLCGKYWGDMTGLPSRRRKATPHPSTSKSTAKKFTPSVDVEKKPSTLTTTDKIADKRITPSVDVEKLSVFTTTTKTNAKIKISSVDVEKTSTLSAKSMHVDAEKSFSLESKKSLKKQVPLVTSPEEFNVEESPQLKERTEPKQSQGCSQLDIKAFLEWEPELESIPKDKNGTESPQPDDPTESDSEKSGLEVKLPLELTDETSSVKSEDPKEEPVDVLSTGSSSQDKEATPSTKAVTSSQMKSMSCVTANTSMEVMVDCYARRDDHRWINMGKNCEGMAPDAVQYIRVLRPAYHLLSFLRMKGYSSKGISRTDKNTMVFVVMEGEVSVTIHTSQFNAKKGDSFYVPPKNSYNLINEKATEAELSLIQFQYDGPLPTASQYDGPLPTDSQYDGPMPTASQYDGPMPTTSQAQN